MAKFPKRAPILKGRLPKYNYGHDSPQHQCCDHHLNDHKTDRVFANKPTRNNAASFQEQVSGPGEPIEHGNLYANDRGGAAQQFGAIDTETLAKRS